MPETAYKLSPNARRVLYYLTDHAERQADGTRVMTVPKTDIAEAAKVDKRSIARILRRLEALGYLTTKVNIGEYGDYEANTYIVHPITAQLATKLLTNLADGTGIEVTSPELVSYTKTQ
jgi:hypothetical protein